MPDEEIGIKVRRYINRMKGLKTHSSKAHSFLDFVEDLFEGEVDADYAEEMYPELEKYIIWKKGAVAIKGRMDVLRGNMIIEFKTGKIGQVWGKEALEESKGQLRKYIYILWRKHGPDFPYLLMASDGLRNYVYRPSLTGNLDDVNPEELSSFGVDECLKELVELEKIDEMDVTEADPVHIHIWLDRYLLYKEEIPLTTENLSEEFGSDSALYKQVIGILRDKWDKIKNKPEMKLFFNQWSKYLEIAYGEKFGEDLFLRHTYLATLSKIMAYMFYSEGAVPGPRQLSQILNGNTFKRWGLSNFIEEDFFTWPLRAGNGFVPKFCRHILGQLSSFEITDMERDVLKGIYQGMVDPAERHELGEYYTPDWLADYITEDLVDDGDDVLDPACGSGTFLVSAINLKEKRLSDNGLEKKEILEEILNSVVGIDIHPIAVLTSKVNYLLALGDLIKERTGEVQIPVYHADSIKLPDFAGQRFGGVGRYEFEADGKKLGLPERVAKDPILTNKVLGEMRAILIGPSESFSEKLTDQLNADENEIIEDLKQNLCELDEKERDSIWLYVIRNLHKPIFLRDRKFDVIIGNPPWLSYRYADSEYQDFLKPMIIEEYGLLEQGKSELITQLELATLFFLRSCDLYLRKNGKIGFVMPRGIFSSDHHDIFRRGSYDCEVGLTKITDLLEVEPLFNAPACIVAAEKGKENDYPISGEAFEGSLDRKNVGWEEAERSLDHRKTRFYFNEAGERSFLSERDTESFLTGSYYDDKFNQGATLVPRNFWFVDAISHPKFGVNPESPYLETTEIKYAKENYKDIKMSGNVSREFLYFTLRGSELVPFSHLPFRLCVLPVRKSGNKLKVLKEKNVRARLDSELAKWVEKAERLWEKKGGKDRDETAVEWLNYRNKIEKQNPESRFKVLYLTSGKNIAACLLDHEKEKFEVEVNGRKIPVKGFVADTKTYYFETDDRYEALYLTSLLNSPSINQMIKGMQSRGLFGERDIHKKVLELSIPQFDKRNAKHQRLAELGEKCTKKANKVLPKWTEKYRGIAWIRKGVREDLSEELDEISELSLKVLSGAEDTRSVIKDYE